MDNGLIQIGLVDGIACALQAAAAACRARNSGAHITGSIVLGCLCGMIGPLLREAFVHGQAGSRQVAAEFPDDVLVGSLFALAALYMVRKTKFPLFFWLDTAGIGAATCVGTMIALDEIGIVGAISIGMINGLAPGLIRDISLGDTATLVDQEWYATSAALGSIATIAVFLLLVVGWVTEWTAANAEMTAISAGFFTVLLLRAWRGKPAIY